MYWAWSEWWLRLANNFRHFQSEVHSDVESKVSVSSGFWQVEEIDFSWQYKWYLPDLGGAGVSIPLWTSLHEGRTFKGQEVFGSLGICKGLDWSEGGWHFVFCKSEGCCKWTGLKSTEEEVPFHSRSVGPTGKAGHLRTRPGCNLCWLFVLPCALQTSLVGWSALYPRTDIGSTWRQRFHWSCSLSPQNCQETSFKCSQAVAGCRCHPRPIRPELGRALAP